MNTRGLTGIVILSVGLQVRILDQSLYSLMIVMAIVTTMMAGPLLHLIYLDRFVVADIAEADRAALGTAAGQRILVLIETPETGAPLVDIGAALAASREHSQLILCHLLAREHYTRSEVATGLGGELRETTRTTGNLQALADRASARGVSAVARSRFSQDIAAELPGYVAAAEPDIIVLGPGQNLPRDARSRRGSRDRHGRAQPAGSAQRGGGPVDARGGRGSRRSGRRATGGRGPAEAGDQSGRRPAREPGRRAHQGWHRR